MLRITAPNGKLLFDVNRGAGSFFVNKKELFYTLKQDVLYDKRAQAISFFYDQSSAYDRGTYHVEVYTDEYLMGSGSFTLK